MKKLVSLCAAGALAGGALCVGEPAGSEQAAKRRTEAIRTVGPTLRLVAQQIPEPRKQFGASATGAFEGWFNQEDGNRGFLIGYFNRNTQQELDIPIGPNNQIEPGGPDMGQAGPTWASRRTSFRAVSGECLWYLYRRISPRKIN
ncbi:MAG: hypothetical protein DMG19_20165 [Acidobacteria bacterium]|nr:MAG: hypothetical protein DMG19_20165 [Acidobacteriota bacterium]